MEFHWTIIFSDKLLINFEFLNKQPGKDVIVGKEEWAQFSQDIYQKQRIDKRTTDYQGVLWGETDIAIFDIQF
jgi:hypothetical protein